MKHAISWGGALVLFVLAGCATPDFLLTSSAPSATKAFRIILDTDPSGADVYWPVDEGVRSVGPSPRHITIQFEKRPVEGFLGHIGMREWAPVVRGNTPQLVRREDNVFVITVPSLTLRKEGFEPETFSGEWRIPVRLKVRVNALEWEDIPMEHRATVVFRTPSRPQFARTLVIESASGPAHVHALNQQGGPGRLIGQTPLTFRMGFAPRRCDRGRTVGWHRWDEQESGLWVHDPVDGNLYLNAVLRREGYAPEILRNYLVLRVAPNQAEQHTTRVHFSQPEEPQAAFTLHLDSLPSNADLYVLREDGSLGQKAGQTPIEVIVGLAQQLRRQGREHEHADWIIWAPDGLMRWESSPEGVANVLLSCALYKDGFAVENVTQVLFQLKPGFPFPEEKVLTIPLFRPEQAAARETRRAIPPPGAPAAAPPPVPDRRAFIWQAPASEHDIPDAPQKLQNDADHDEQLPWWKRIVPMRFR